MYDHVTFRHRMPDGYVGGEDEYQTKDLRFENGHGLVRSNG
jgi:hypothetical protein